MAVHARSLEKSEWAVFRDMRLLALQTEPQAFSSSYESAASRTPEDWQHLIEAADHQIFGLFDEARLVGITGVFTAHSDPSSRTAILVMSFILPEYRRRGFSNLLYDVRLRWIRRQGKFTSVIVSHRESNEASRRANQHYGFRFLRQESRSWPDGATEAEVYYELPLSSDGQISN